MKIKCDDGITRRFILPYQYSESWIWKSYCVECGERFDPHDTNIMKQLFGKHISCVPNQAEEEPRSLSFWMRKYGFKWDKSRWNLISNDPDYYTRNEPKWKFSDVICKLEYMYKKKMIWRSETGGFLLLQEPKKRSQKGGS